MVIALVPLFVAIVGLLMWCLASNGKVAEIGKILFFCGTLALMFSTAKGTLRIGQGEPSRPLPCASRFV